MTTTQGKLLMIISELMTELSKQTRDQDTLLKLNTAHFFLVKMARTLSDQTISIEV